MKYQFQVMVLVVVFVISSGAAQYMGEIIPRHTYATASYLYGELQ